MRSVNKVILMGNLGGPPEMRSTKTGKTVTNFSLATNNEWQNQEGEQQKTTDFHKVIAWQGLGEICGKHLKKGSPVYIEGRLHNRSYEDKEKNRRYVTEVTADKVNFIQTKSTKDGEKVGLKEAGEPVAA
ncbi:single-stranded DNA-binding protein [Candidatus Peregrinibacteria bacterium]|jgi:single-strand DNA-binding protein|nr:single-stranded DNA-binding protein [Candidatus Peregrinibacteria bacterium]MBT7484150.1 single-stranded DNA-binding protein [Candidatus Peregrinibacteria bacterium]MBT7703530.1 single-stranded DNA-binding protein [Candidatus Peregrinibacteria bacterium]